MTHVAILSGGLDSTVALAEMLEKEKSQEALAVSFDYGQRHVKEVEAAEKIASFYGVPFEVINVKGLMEGSALLVESDIPDGHYADDNMKTTVVHGRNMLFASVAVSRAREGGQVWLGVHGGDHFIYPDCRPDFWTPYGQAVKAAYDVDVVTPFISASKADVASRGAELGAPLELTWSCYKGGDIHCGTCGTCVERKEAFQIANLPDPTEYAA